MMTTTGLQHGRYGRAYPWFFVGPALLVTTVLTVAPIFQLVRASVHDWELGEGLANSEFIGVENFRGILLGEGGTSLGHSLKLTAYYVIAALVIEILLGLFMALLIERTLRGQSLMMSVLLIPMVLMPTMVAMVWRLYFSYEGLVNWMLSIVQIPAVNWFSTSWALSAVVIVDVWQWTPFFVLIFLAGLQAIPREVVEAASVDGAGSWQIVRFIKVPFLGPLIVIASTLRIMELLRQFDLVFVMFGGGPGNATEILPLAVYRTTVPMSQAGAGAAFSLILILLVVAVAWQFIILMKRYRTEL